MTSWCCQPLFESFWLNIRRRIQSPMTDMPITRAQLQALEDKADKVFNKLGIDIEFTRHFLDRVNDERNQKQITIKELGQLFAKEYMKWGRTISKMPIDAEAVMKDLSSEINIPFAIDDAGNKKELVTKTVMRKKDFKTPNKQLPVESINEDYNMDEKVVVQGLGTYSVGTLQKSIAWAFKDLAKRAESNDPFEFRQISKIMNGSHGKTLRVKLEALIKAYDDMDIESNKVIENQDTNYKGFDFRIFERGRKSEARIYKHNQPNVIMSKTFDHYDDAYKWAISTIDKKVDVGVKMKESKNVQFSEVNAMWEHYQKTNQLIESNRAVLTIALKDLDKIVKDSVNQSLDKLSNKIVTDLGLSESIQPNELADMYRNWRGDKVIKEGWMNEADYYLNEDRPDDYHADVEYTHAGKTKKATAEKDYDKVIAKLSAAKSGVFTKLAKQYKRIYRAEKAIAARKKKMNEQLTNEIEAIFPAIDDIYTRVLETKSMVVKLGKKTEAGQVEYMDMAKYVEELERLVEPHLTKPLEQIQAQFTSLKDTPEKKPNLYQPQLKESNILSKLKNWASKVVGTIKKTLSSFDNKFDRLSKEALGEQSMTKKSTKKKLNAEKQGGSTKTLKKLNAQKQPQKKTTSKKLNATKHVKKKPTDQKLNATKHVKKKPNNEESTEKKSGNKEMSRSIYAEGFNAGRNGTALTNNPYIETTNEFMLWQIGWKDSGKD